MGILREISPTAVIPGSNPGGPHHYWHKTSAFSLPFPKQFDVVNFTYILEEIGVSYALRQWLN